MASYKKSDHSSKSTENKSTLKILNELYGKALHYSIIESVAKSQQWQLEKTCCILSDMTDNVSSMRPKNLKKFKTQKLNSVAYSALEDNNADVLVEEHASRVRNRAPPPRKKIGGPPTNQGRQKAAQPIDNLRATIRSGVRVMVLLRGLPGSGKSHLAQYLVKSTVPPSEQNGVDFIFSTDDYFCRNPSRTYIFNPTQLPDAHGWNQQRVFQSAQLGVSPIIVDNTHTQAWEMRPYVFAAAKYGYLLETLEPTTPWMRNVAELTRRNRHAVPRKNIADMHLRYEHNMSGPALITMFNVQYAPNMRPPQRRLYPPTAAPTAPRPNKRSRSRKGKPREQNSSLPSVQTDSSQEQMILPDQNDQLSDETWDSDNDGTWENLNSSGIVTGDLLSSDNGEPMEYVLVNPDNTFVYQKAHDDLSIDETPLQHNSQDLINFNDENEKSASGSNAHLLDDVFGSDSYKDGDDLLKQLQDGLKLLNIKTDGAVDHSTETFVFPELNLDSNSLGGDWKANSWFRDETTVSTDTSARRKYSTELLQQMECQEAATNTSSLDFVQLTRENYTDGVKVLYGTGRDIISDSQLLNRKVIAPPKKLMLHKGTTTGAEIEDAECSSKGQHLRTLFNLFPQVQPDVLKDIFDKCQGDVNWAVDLLLECNQELSSEEPASTQSDCPSEYELQPSIEPPAVEGPVNTEQPKSQLDGVGKVTKPKNDKTDEELKRHIEERFKIADEHYSNYLLNLRRRRHGETSAEETETARYDSNADDEAEEEDVASGSSSEEELVELTLGTELVQQLERQFGRADGEKECPIGFQPVVQLPASMARQLHALWLQSVCTQWRAHSSILQDIERQDRELARILQQREHEENAQHHSEQLGLQEIMDMEIALAVYRADQQQWQLETPDDLASRMTRQKLFEAFPELERNLLTEILQAHDNSFENTVQALMCSLGRTECETFVSKNGRIVPREDGGERLARQLETVKSEPPRLDWVDTSGKEDTLTAEQYREQAAHHLTMRQRLLSKASDCAQKGMPQVAAYYADVARLYMHKYELANGRAACAFLYEHQSQQSARTLDLHFLYVREAEQALALFLDSEISRLRHAGRPHDTVFIITGRGNHSAGGVSHIKPAVKRRLKERRLGYAEMNPGLLRVLLTKHSLLTNDLKSAKPDPLPS